MDDLLKIAKDTWEKYGQGQHSLIVAASVTNAVFATFEAVECRLKASFEVSDPETLNNKLLQAGICLGSSTKDQTFSNSNISQLLDALKLSWCQLLALRQLGPSKACENASGHQPHSHVTIRNSANSEACDRQCLGVMLQNIVQLITPGNACTKSTIIRMGSPVYPEVGYLLTQDTKDGVDNGLRCSFGLQLILESYKSCLFAPKSARLPSTCRLHALRFAQEAVSSTQAILDHPTMPCSMYIFEPSSLARLPACVVVNKCKRLLQRSWPVYYKIKVEVTEY